MFNKANRPIGYDFTCYYASAKAMMHGLSPYNNGTAFPYIYPPIFAFLLIPLAIMPYGLSNFVWYCLGVFALIFSTVVILNTIDEDKTYRNTVKLAFLFLLILIVAFNALQNNFLNGQANLFILLFCILFYKFWKKGSWIAAGVCLAIAISVKITPFPILLFLLIKRDYRTLAASIVAAALLLVVPSIVCGLDSSSILREYVRNVHQVSSTYTPQKYCVPLLNGELDSLFPKFGVNKFAGISALIFLLFAAIVQLRFEKIYPQNTGFRMLCLYFAIIPLISPICEAHHLVMVIPAFIYLAIEMIYDIRPYPTTSKLHLSAFLVCWILGSVLKHSPFTLISMIILIYVLALPALKRQKLQKALS